MVRLMTTSAALALVLAMPAGAQQPASTTTRAANAAALAAEAPDEAREAAEDAAAARGRIAQIPDGVIRDASGTILLDWRPYAFLEAATAPDTVNPRLWRQARRNAQHGLFEVVPGAIWQVRGYDLSVMTVIKGDSGWIIVDPLTVTWIMVGALVIAVLASVLPAFRAASLHPVEALRYE